MSLGFVFPGQGSQAVGMLGDLADEFPQIREHFDPRPYGRRVVKFLRLCRDSQIDR